MSRIADVRQLYRTQKSAGLMKLLSPTISEVAIGLMTLFSNVPSQTLLHLSHRDLVVTFRSGDFQRPVVLSPVERT